MRFASYQEWKTKNPKARILEEADQILSSAYKPREGLLSEVKILRIMTSPEAVPQAVSCSMASQKKVMELGEILAKIEGMQRLYRCSLDEGNEASVAKCKEILEALFELAHLKLDEGKQVFFSQFATEEAPVENQPPVEEVEEKPEREDSTEADTGWADNESSDTISLV